VGNDTVFTFGDYSLDTRSELLTRQGKPINLPPKIFQALVILVHAYPAVVTKEDLRAELWPDTVVEEAALTQTIYTLRKLLGRDSEGSDFVQTVPRRGYRFQKPVTAELPPERVPVVARYLRPALATLALAGLISIALLIPKHAPGLQTADSPRLRRAVELTETGRAIWKQRRAGPPPESYFRQALDIAPEYLPAQIGLADALALSGRSPEADQIVARVLRQDRRIGEAHATAGLLAMIHHWDWTTAISELDQAVQLAPQYTTGLQWQALYYELTGNQERALAILQTALAIEPASLNLLSDQCQTLYFALRTNEAIAACGKVLAIDPRFTFAQNHLREIYSYLGDAQQALPHFYPSFTADQPERYAAARQRFDPVALREGIPGLWRELIRPLKEDALPGTSYGIAVGYAFQRDYERAIAELAQAQEHHEFLIVFASAEPAFIPLRKDPRFRRICANIGLPVPN
jgi:DNA-binding winged helix-turn-helix (wHTH) protein/tetratricopeptide (TPR) repeat protein